MQNDYTRMPDEALLENIRHDADRERHHGLAVLYQLREVARRRLDARMGYSSLHKYCMEELKYSSGSAWRRIQAMDALEQLPELAPKIERGELTIANVSQVQHFCEKSERSLDEKKALFQAVEGLSKRDVERTLARIAPEPERPDRLRPIDGDKSELTVTLDHGTVQALDRIKGLLSHSRPNATYSELIAYLARMGEERLDPALRRARRSARADGSVAKRLGRQGVTLGVNGTSETSGKSELTGFPPGEDRASPNVEPLGAEQRRNAWRKDGSRCAYVDPKSGRRCGAISYVQVDHRVPRAMGGSNEPGNLGLLCRRHNLLNAIDALGRERVGPYLKR